MSRLDRYAKCAQCGLTECICHLGAPHEPFVPHRRPSTVVHAHQCRCCWAGCDCGCGEVCGLNRASNPVPIGGEKQ